MFVLAVAWAGANSRLGAQTAAEGPTEQLPAVVVTATNALAEEQLVGPNQQPEWTTRRRFATTQIYVLEPWQIEFEQMVEGKISAPWRCRPTVSIGTQHWPAVSVAIGFV